MNVISAGGSKSLLGRKTGTRTLAACLCVWLLGCSASALAAEADVAEANRLIAAGRHADAVGVLEAGIASHRGDVNYTYTLGLAALEAAQYEKAIVYLRRVVAMQPSNVGARLDLARAYFGLGSATLAEREFKAAAQLNPPPAAQQTIRQYLLAIEQKQSRASSGLTGYLEAGAGYDSNITSVTGEFTSGILAAYNIAGVVPTGNSIKRSDGYASVSGGLAYRLPLNDRISLVAGIDGRSQNYFSEHDYDSLSVSGRAGLAWADSDDLVRVLVNGQQYWQQTKRVAPFVFNNDRDSVGLLGEWYRTLDAQNRVGAFYQYTEYRYDTQGTQDVDQDLYGANWVHAFSGKGAPLLSLSVFQSKDVARHTLSPLTTAKVSKTNSGVSAYGQYSLDSANDLFVQLAFTQREDDSAFARSVTTRIGRDDLWSATVGVVHRIDSRWSLRGQLSHADNRSNIALYNYERSEASVAVRYDFR